MGSVFKKHILITILGLLLLAPLGSICADSPITSTPFYEAYTDIAIVQKAKIQGVLDMDMAEYLSSQSATVKFRGHNT